MGMTAVVALLVAVSPLLFPNMWGPGWRGAALAITAIALGMAAWRLKKRLLIAGPSASPEALEIIPVIPRLRERQSTRGIQAGRPTSARARHERRATC